MHKQPLCDMSIDWGWVQQDVSGKWSPLWMTLPEVYTAAVN